MHTLRNGCGGLDFFQVSIKNYSSKYQNCNLHYIILITNYATDGSMVIKREPDYITTIHGSIVLLSPGDLMDEFQILI